VIGEHEDCPVRVFAGMWTEGDGMCVVDRVSIGSLFASREAAIAAGYPARDIYEYVLGDDGRYVAQVERNAS
jgi:hypothetical protein